MFLIAQIPFVDLRLLSDHKEYSDCIFPNTFVKNMDHEIYYRFLGKEKLRYSPINLPDSERQYFDSSNVIHLERDMFAGNEPYQPRLVFSRLFEENQSFHFDIGIREIAQNQLSRKDLDRFIKQFMVSPIFRITKRYDKNGDWYNFTELMEQIKKIYLYATKCKKVSDKVQDEPAEHSHDVILGYPALFVTYNKDEIHTFGNAQKYILASGIEIWHDLIPVKNIWVNVWFIGKNDLAKYNQELRNLRIYLSKLHSYKESLRIILDRLKRRNELSRDRLLFAFEHILSNINREKYYGNNNKDFWNLVFEVDNTYNNVSWTGYIKQIDAYIKVFKGGTMNINYGIYVNGNNGDGSPLICNAQDVNVSIAQRSEMQEYMRYFDAKYEELLRDNQLTNEQIKQLQDSFDNFKDYMTEKAPRKGIASVLLENVKSILGDMISNPERVAQLILFGQKMVDLLK